MKNFAPQNIDTGVAEQAYGIADFDNFEQLQQQPALLVSLAQCYCEIFAEPGIWAEHYSQQQVLTKLQNELRGPAALRVFTEPASDEVIAFCWAQYLAPAAVIEAIASVEYVQSQTQGQSQPLQLESLQAAIGEQPLIYLQDLGIRKDHRGNLSLVDLIHPTLERVAASAGTRRLFFWSVKATCISWLAEKSGIAKVYEQADMCFFRSELPSAAVLRQIAESTS